MMRSFVLAVVVAALAAAFPFAGARGEDGSFYQGLSAYNAGDYTQAAKVWAPLAASGDANAQSGLGLLYYSGFGVRRDLTRARELFLEAAEQGVVQSQMFLSLMYFRGDGVRRDYRLAYMWSDNAVALGYEQAIDFRSRVAEYLSADEVREAARLAAEWRARPPSR